MEVIIIDWLKQISMLDSTVDAIEYRDSCSDSFPCATFYNNKIGEVDIEDIDSVEMYPEMVFKGSELVNEKLVLNGFGYFTLKNGDYFKGEFHGGLLNRDGRFVQLSNAGSTVEGIWRNGKAEVFTASQSTSLPLNTSKQYFSMNRHMSYLSILL